jgi:hypothetical protein
MHVRVIEDLMDQFREYVRSASIEELVRMIEREGDGDLELREALYFLATAEVDRRFDRI